MALLHNLRPCHLHTMLAYTVHIHVRRFAITRVYYTISEFIRHKINSFASVGRMNICRPACPRTPYQFVHHFTLQSTPTVDVDERKKTTFHGIIWSREPSTVSRSPGKNRVIACHPIMQDQQHIDIRKFRNIPEEALISLRSAPYYTQL